jgi:DNA repair exonuclease SbcCD ATPase subunit
MQQDDEDRKNEIVVEGFEDKIRKREDSLKEKDSLLRSTKGSLAEAQAQNEKLSKELKKTQTLLEENSSRFNRETEALNMTVKVEAEKNMKLSETLKDLKNKCFSFAAQCTARLKSIFNSVGAASEEANLSAEDIPEALECIEKEVDVLDEVITGHGDLCALVASRGTTAAFIKAGCNHASVVNRPNFSMSPSDIIDIPVEAQSICNRFVTQIWAKGGRELAVDEARNLLNKV